MTSEQLSELIGYAESAAKDGYPFEVKGEDLAIVLRGLKALTAAAALLSARDDATTLTATMELRKAVAGLQRRS